MSRQTSSSIEIAFALIFSAAILAFQATLFVARTVKNLRAEWDNQRQQTQGNDTE